MTPYVLFAIIRLSHPEPWKLGEGGDTMNRYTIARNIEALCIEQNISVEVLAEAINKSPRQTSRYRSGACKNIPYDTLVAMANALHTSVTDLLS